MGWWSRVTGGELPAAQEEIAESLSFAVDAGSIPAQIFGLESYADPIAVSPRIDRASAIQVPAVKRSRDLICGTLGGLPLDMIDSDNKVSTRPLFDQPERDVPRSVTMARLFEDMLYEGVGWWRITETDWQGYPTKVRRLLPRSVDLRQDGKVYVRSDGSSQGMSWEWLADDKLIRFESPNDGLLTAGARAIRTCLMLDQAALNHANGTPPLDYFRPADDADPAEDDEITEILNAWQEARKKRSTGYVPAALVYEKAGFNPEQLQMAEARQHAVLEIARLAGIDPEELGVSTTSRTYANQYDRRKNFVDFTLGDYRQAVEDRLSMGDVTPRGYSARFDLSSFLRSDDKTRFETYQLGLAVGAIGKSEIRPMEHKPPLDGADATPAPAPAPLRAVPDQEETG